MQLQAQRYAGGINLDSRKSNIVGCWEEVQYIIIFSLARRMLAKEVEYLIRNRHISPHFVVDSL